MEEIQPAPVFYRKTTRGQSRLEGATEPGAHQGSARTGNSGNPDADGPARFSKSLKSYLHFFLAGLVHREQTGGIVPSQKFLIEKMISAVPPSYTGTIVELGTGSGVLTVRLAQRCPLARIVACEINPTLARDTEMNLARSGIAGNVQVVCDSAEKLLPRLREEGQELNYIISGIPLGNLNREQSFALIRCIHSALSKGGMYIQFQHSLLDRKKIETSFSKLKTVQAFLNFPPAVVYYAEK